MAQVRCKKRAAKAPASAAPEKKRGRGGGSSGGAPKLFVKVKGVSQTLQRHALLAAVRLYGMPPSRGYGADYCRCYGVTATRLCCHTGRCEYEEDDEGDSRESPYTVKDKYHRLGGNVEAADGVRRICIFYVP